MPADQYGVMDEDADVETPAYLFMVEYDDEAERKRVEYLFNNWDEGTIDKPRGLIRVVSGTDHDDIFEGLISKVPPEQVSSYKLDPVNPDVTPETCVVEEVVQTDVDAVESFVEYMLSKKKAVLQSASRNEYEIYTKKGRAEVTYELSDQDGATKVTLRITGYSPAPEFLEEFFQTELTDYSASQA